MPVITISRQIGTQGRAAARLLAEHLGFRLVWRELINQAARRAGAPDMALAAIDELGLLNIYPDPQDCAAYHAAVRQVILELADEGEVVILGRAGQVILSGRPDVFHVRLIAPPEVRAQRLAAAQQISQTAALEQIKASDRYRKNYLKKYYNADWNDPALYDLVINTAHLDPSQTAAVIYAAARARLQTQPPGLSQELHR